MKLPRPVRHVIFDLDGVLLDSEDLYTRATAEVAGRYGKVYDWSIKANTIGRGTLDAGRYVVRTLDLPLTAEQFVAARDAILLDLWPTLEPIPGAVEFTQKLADRAVPMAIATSTETELYGIKAARHSKWLSTFRAVVCGDDPRVVRSKPAPDIFLAAAAELGANPASCVVFEDSPSGAAGAIAAGMQVVALPDPHIGRDGFAAAHLVIDGFSSITLDDLGLIGSSR